MMKKLMLVAAGGVGYVLGAKAGRERYEQIMDQAQKIRKNPAVKQSMGEARTKAQEAAGMATEKVKHKMSSSDTGNTSAAGAGPTYPAAPNGFGLGDEQP